MPKGSGKIESEKVLAQALKREPRLAWLAEVRAALPDAEWFLVGGAVRDLLLGRPLKDFDFVVRLVEVEELSAVLERMGRVDLVGRTFGVLKFRPSDSEDQFDIAWPRTERAGGSGAYRDFSVQSDPELSIERDLARRDFTVNAMAWDFQQEAIIDKFTGRVDLEAKKIRAVGEPAKRFAEDYSRLLRAVRFACQLEFEIEAETWAALQHLVPHLDDTCLDGDGGKTRVVPYETIARELLKALAADASRAVDLLEHSGALFRLIPELKATVGCAQSSDHHAEGDVWTHTKLALTQLSSPEFAQLFPGAAPDVTVAVAILLHDIAKPRVAARDGEKWTFYGHEVMGEALARSVANRLKLASAPEFDVTPERLGWLVRQHMFPHLVRVDEVRKTTLERYFLADREAGRQLLQLAGADALASHCGDSGPDLSNIRELQAAVAEMERQAGEGESVPPRLLGGEEIMAITDLQAGPEVGRLLDELREEQLQGRVTTVEEAREFIRRSSMEAPV